MPVAVAALVLLLLAALGSGPAQAEVRRCERADGSAIYTDRACGEFGAIERARSHAPGGAARPGLRRGCARSLQELMSEVTTAIQDQDANRLAGVYHWVGMSGRSGYAVMARLDALVRRPLVDVVPVIADAPDMMIGNAEQPPPADAERAVALRLEQTEENGVTPARTTFGLQRHFGCLWISG